jgi:hypothetical protein
MPERDETNFDRGSSYYRDEYLARRGNLGRFPLPGVPRTSEEDYAAKEEAREGTSFLSRLAQMTAVAGGIYMVGRTMKRDSIMESLHALGQVGRRAVKPFRAGTRAFVEEILGRATPQHRGIGRAFLGARRPEYSNLELIEVLSNALDFRSTYLDQVGAPAGLKGFRGAITNFDDIVREHVSKKYLRSHDAAEKLRYVTVGHVLESADIQQKIGKHQFKVLKEAHARGLVSDRASLSSSGNFGLFKNEFGEILDTRWADPRAAGQSMYELGRNFQILGFRPVELFANVVRPFTKGKFFAELGGGLPIGSGLRIPQAGSAFGIGGKIFVENITKPGHYVPFGDTRTRYKFFGITEGAGTLAGAFQALIGEHPLQKKVIADTTPGYGREHPYKLAWERMQDMLGVGPGFRTRPHVIEQMVLHPLKRKQAEYLGGAFIPFRRKPGEGGLGHIARRDSARSLVQQLDDWVRGLKPADSVVETRAREFGRVMETVTGTKDRDYLAALFGWERRGTFVTSEGVKALAKTGQIGHEHLAVWQPSFHARVGQRLITKLGAGDPVYGRQGLYRTVRNYAIKGGFGDELATLGNYMTIRLNDLLSATMGIGFRPGVGKVGPLTNVARLYGAYWGARGAVEVADYTDYLLESTTGVSPKKTALQGYSFLRENLQRLREGVGVGPAARYLEDLMPGSVDSPLSYGLRFIYPLYRGLVTAGTSGFIGGGVISVLMGFGDLTKTPEEIEREHTGEKLIPYRKGRWWMLGRQPFGGGQIDYFGPSWIARQLSDYKYTDSLYGSRADYFRKVSFLPTPSNLFTFSKDNEFLAKKHHFDRPYPYDSSGEGVRAHEQLIQSNVERDVYPAAAGTLGIPDIQSRPPPPMGPYGAQGRIGTAIDHLSELGGIYKFILWDMAGFGDKQGARNRAASADAMSSHSRHYYDEQLGGLLGMTEMYRRFVPDEKERFHRNTIPNAMPAWMPGTRSMFTEDRHHHLDFTVGDPYTKVRHGEARLPGAGYDALHRLHSGTPGVYDPMDRFLMLADVAPYSASYRHYKAIVQGWMKAGVLDSYWGEKFDMTIDQVKQKMAVYQFSPRRFFGMNDSSEEQIEALNEYNSIERAVGGAWEVATHEITPRLGKIFPLFGPVLGDKLMAQRSPIETYKKWELYGEDFADWTEPWQSFLRPKMHELVASDPATATLGGAMLGMFGANPLARIVMGGAGAVGFGAASTARLVTTGRVEGGYVPAHRESERELKEYMDHLKYAKNRYFQELADVMNDRQMSTFYRKQAGRTVAGLDYELPLDKFVNTARSALDKRERAYFDAFSAVSDPHARQEILEMVPRYVKPVYEAVWAKTDPENRVMSRHSQRVADAQTAEYFRENAMPPTDWAGWHPSVPMNAIRMRAVNDQALDIHRFNLWDGQRQEIQEQFPFLKVPIGNWMRQSADHSRHAVMDVLQRHSLIFEPRDWQGGLQPDGIQWNVIDDDIRSALTYAGSVLSGMVS